MSHIKKWLSQNLPTPIHQIQELQFEDKGVQLFLKRDDLIHPEISGNKWRKLKYNLIAAQQQQHDTILTFGGAYSNHIAATAAACRLVGMKSIGIIRGEELSKKENRTLRKAADDGMRLKFISRENYRRKTEAAFLETLGKQFQKFFLIPEGGSNELGIKGCAEIMNEVQEQFDFICVACGTGTTMAGILSATHHKQNVIGFPAFKSGEDLEKVLQQLLNTDNNTADSCELMSDYHFGGYARHTPELLQFIRSFKAKHQIELDFIYTGKMLFGVYDLIQKDFFPSGSKILAIHTGGLQGNQSIWELFDY